MPHVREVGMSTLAKHGLIPATKRSYAEALRGTSPLNNAEWVYVRRGGQGKPLSDNYSGPYFVLERREKAFKLQVGTRVEVVRRDRLKPHMGKKLPEPAEPPRRGRPPGSGSLLLLEED